jgi:hypothetical protein
VPEASALGIDPGIRFSEVAHVNDARLLTVLPNAEGPPTTPSVVLPMYPRARGRRMKKVHSRGCSPGPGAEGRSSTYRDKRGSMCS